MKLIKENVSRKIDSLGRVSVPKSLRDRLEIREGDMIDFFLLEDEDRFYVSFRKHIDEDNEKYVQIAKLMEEVGLDIPEEIGKYL